MKMFQLLSEFPWNRVLSELNWFNLFRAAKLVKSFATVAPCCSVYINVCVCNMRQADARGQQKQLTGNWMRVMRFRRQSPGDSSAWIATRLAGQGPKLTATAATGAAAAAVAVDVAVAAGLFQVPNCLAAPHTHTLFVCTCHIAKNHGPHFFLNQQRLRQQHQFAYLFVYCMQSRPAAADATRAICDPMPSTPSLLSPPACPPVCLPAALCLTPCWWCFCCRWLRPASVWARVCLSVCLSDCVWVLLCHADLF